MTPLTTTTPTDEAAQPDADKTRFETFPPGSHALVGGNALKGRGADAYGPQLQASADRLERVLDEAREKALSISSDGRLSAQGKRAARQEAASASDSRAEGALIQTVGEVERGFRSALERLGVRPLAPRDVDPDLSRPLPIERQLGSLDIFHATDLANRVQHARRAILDLPTEKAEKKLAVRAAFLGDDEQDPEPLTAYAVDSIPDVVKRSLEREIGLDLAVLRRGYYEKLNPTAAAGLEVWVSVAGHVRYNAMRAHKVIRQFFEVPLDDARVVRAVAPLKVLLDREDAL